MTSNLTSNNQEHELKKATMRSKNFQESKPDYSKHRYGLFSFTGTLAISDKVYENPTVARKNPDGTVMTSPRNFSTSPVKKGITADAFFSTPSYTNVGDNYKGPSKPQLNEKLRAQRMRNAHPAPFRGSGPIKSPPLAYEYIPSPPPNRKPRVSPEKDVLVEPRNFYTSPPKKGATFSPNPSYIHDNYESKRELLRKELKEHQAKTEGRPFRNMHYGNKEFSEFKSTVGSDIDTKKSPQHKKSPSIEKPFVPANPGKKGKLDTFEKYPEHIEEPPKETRRRSPDSQAPWKITYKDLSKPSPSVQCMKQNIKSEFPQLRIR